MSYKDEFQSIEEKYVISRKFRDLLVILATVNNSGVNM